VLLLIQPDNVAAMVKNDETVAGCALVKGADVVGHGLFSIDVEGLKYQF
jgi:hypothetical protein